MTKDTGFYRIESNDIGKWCLCIDPIPHGNANDSILAICDSIEVLSQNAKLEWDEALFKEFYIGYKISPDTHCLIENLSPQTIQRAAKLGSGIGIAMYPADPDD